jgi:RNA recognition motif-containing protein
MMTDEGAQAAIGRFNGFSFQNRNLTVNEAKPREARDSGGGRPYTPRSGGSDYGDRGYNDRGGGYGSYGGYGDRSEKNDRGDRGYNDRMGRDRRDRY